VTKSEKLLSSFAENFFYKEFVYADLKFTPKGGTEIELADLIINFEDIVLAIQLKERNEKDRTQDKNIEERWLKKKCKKAKEQIKDTLVYIQNSEAEFYNARGRKAKINPNAEIVPLVIFENKNISEYTKLNTEECLKELLKFNGVGPKVGDCIALFGMQKYDTFPVDVWVKRVMQEFYVEEDLSLPKIRAYAIDKFKELSGFAQQYLFYYARELGIGR
jgi:hypothetical protein